MIGVKLNGRMGNQLFQYAFAYAIAKKLNTTFYLDKRFAENILSKYFLISDDKFQWLDRLIFSIQTDKNFFSSYLKLGFYSKVKSLLRLNEIEFSNDIAPTEEMIKIANNMLYSGFFQSEAYFNDYKTEIISQFQLNNYATDQFKNIPFKVPEGFKTVVLHIRRTDYIDHEFDLPIDYFHNAIAKIDHPGNYYIIISDDPIFAAKAFEYLRNKYISDHNEIVDFQFLMHADICILSNSSFSWWGAYLNQKAELIIAPEYWLGFSQKTEHPVDVIPRNWIKI